MPQSTPVPRDGDTGHNWVSPLWVERQRGPQELPAPSPVPPSPILAATDKVALLIGNMHYLHHKQLKAPMVDVHALSALLRQLDFKVVSLLDLRKAEMQMAVNEFLLLLDKGVYGAAVPNRVAPAGGNRVVLCWWGLVGRAGKKWAPAGQGMSLLSPAPHRFALLRRARL